MRSENTGQPTSSSAAEALRKDGYAWIGPVFEDALVTRLDNELRIRHGGLFVPGASFGNALQTGDRRYMVTIELSGAFADPMVYANPAVLAVLQAALGADFVLTNFGMVLSLPGAGRQHTHRDGQNLFDAGFASLLPAHAVTVGIPLRDMNGVNGTTEVAPGSHRLADGMTDVALVSPEVPAGSCLMWDYRTLHRGTPNRSSTCRPLLYFTYGKPWWRDLPNYKTEWTGAGPVARQKPLLFGKSFLESVPQDKRFLFRHIDAAS